MTDLPSNTPRRGAPPGRTNAPRRLFSIALGIFVPLLSGPFLRAQEADSVGAWSIGEARVIMPLGAYVTVKPYVGSARLKDALTISREDAERIVIQFDRDALPKGSGPQFVKISTTVTDAEGTHLDQTTQYAFTFPREETPGKDQRMMDAYARQILQFGYLAKGRSDSVEVVVDTLPGWASLRVEVVPDEEYTKYTNRNNSRLVWHYKIRGHWLDSKFTLGIPKVIYDSRATDTVDYGNASALLRFFYIDQGTGAPFPVSVGVGLYGVSTPIDVSSRGGGFVVTLYFDIMQFLRVNGVEITDRANAGLEIAPFFPVDHRSRVLLSARIGYTP